MVGSLSSKVSHPRRGHMWSDHCMVKKTQNSQIALSSSGLRRRSWGSQVWNKQHASDLKIPGPTIFLRKPILRRSLVVQWLELCAADVEAMGSIPSQGTRSHMLQPGMRAC